MCLVCGLEQVQGDAGQAGEVLGGVALADAAVVFAEVDVQAPVQVVLHAPVAADVLQQPRGVVGRQAADVVAVLAGGLAVDRPLGLDADEAAQVLPLALLGEPVDLRGRPDSPLLDPAVALVDGRGRAVGDAVAVVGQALVEELHRLLVQRALVALELQEVVAALVDDLLGDLLLAAGRVDGDHRPVHVQQLQQFGDGRDLVALGVGGQLPQDHVIGLAPGADHVDGRLAVGRVQAAADRLAVDGDQPAGRGGGQVGDPLHEALLEGHRVQRREDPAEGVVRGDAVGQVQEGLEPLPLAAAELGHLHPAVGPADDGADGDGQDVAQSCASWFDSCEGPSVRQMRAADPAGRQRPC